MISTDAEKFWDKTIPEPNTGCWLWMGATSGTDEGRGHVRMPNGRFEHAARAALRLSGVDIPDGAVVRHKCDNPPCVNPGHLEIGTYFDNTADSIRRGRRGRSPLRSREARPRWCERLTAARERLGISQRQLGIKAGYSRVFIYRIETGATRLMAEDAVRLAETLGISLQSLLA